MQFAIVCTILLVCEPIPIPQTQDSTAIHRLVFESIKYPGKSLLLDKRVLEIHEDTPGHLYRRQHNDSFIEHMIATGLVDGVCEPIPSSRLPAEKWRCRGNPEVTAISIGHIWYDGEEHAECFVYWDSVQPYSKAPYEPLDYNHYTTLEKYRFRLGEKGWFIEDRIGMLDTDGSWHPPPEYPVTNVDKWRVK